LWSTFAKVVGKTKNSDFKTCILVISKTNYDKKIIIIFAVVFSLAYTVTSFNNEETTVYIDSNETSPNIETAGFITEVPEFLTAEEEALRCKVYDSDGNLIASCWFCDCAGLIEAMR